MDEHAAERWRLAIEDAPDHPVAVVIDGRPLRLFPFGDGGWWAVTAICARCGRTAGLRAAGERSAELECAACDTSTSVVPGGPGSVPCLSVDDEVYVLVDDELQGDLKKTR